MRIPAILCVSVLACLAAHAADAQILVEFERYFEDPAPGSRARCIERIEADPAYHRSKVAGWFARLPIFEPLEPGRREIVVPIDVGRDTRLVVLRIPKAYTPQTAWPLVYALHGTGGDGESIIRYLEQALGDDVEEFIIAAPTDYTHYAIQVELPHSTQHSEILIALKRLCRVDSERVYLTGYSRGGHGSWTLAILHADQFAAVVPVAGTLVLPEVDRLWDAFLPNLANTPVLNVWGGEDRYMDNGRTPATDGGIAGLNRRLRDAAARMKLPIESIEDEERGHGGVLVPLPELRRALQRRRSPSPKRVRHAFRDPYQASAYWLEGAGWSGAAWTDEEIKVEMNEGESPGEAIARAIRGRLGEIRGEVDGQTVSLHRKKVKELTVWFDDEMIDWSRPVVVKSAGRVAYEGTLTPSLAVCLAQAARTYDFQHLRWAGVRVPGSGKGEVVAPADR